MQQTINIRTAQRSSALQEWLDGKSETFSLLCGEFVTRQEVLKAHAVLLAVLTLIGIGGAF